MRKFFLPSAAILIILFTFFLIRSNIFIIRSVDVQSEKIECAGNEQIKDSSDVVGQNFLLIDSKKIENDLKKKFLCIKWVQTSKFFPNKIGLKIFGREPAAILVVSKNEEATSSGGLESFSRIESTPSAQASSSASFSFSVDGPAENFVIDNEGVAYSKNTERISALKIYTGEVKEDLISKTLKILEKVKLFGINIKETKIYSESTLLINAVPKIIFKLDNIDTQIASLQLILEKSKIDDSSLEFIDLRFDKPVIRIAPKK